MPAHKSKNFRFRIIDECLRDTTRTWSLDDLIAEVSKKLSDEFNVEKVSRRSIQYDISLMREQPPIGYGAPIVCNDGNYSYADENFSIQNMQLSKPDIENLTEVINTLKQYKQYSHLGNISKLIEKIETIITLNPQPNSPYASFEETTNSANNLQWLKQLIDAVMHKQVLELSLRENGIISTIVLHPYFLKEYHNNWYIYGINDGTTKLIVVSLQNIIAISPQISTFIENETYTIDNYFNYLYGITPGETDKPANLRLKIASELVPTFLMNPINETQTIEDSGFDGSFVDCKVIINKDLEEKILQYGTKIRVNSPDKLRKHIVDELKKAEEAYKQLSLF